MLNNISNEHKLLNVSLNKNIVGKINFNSSLIKTNVGYLLGSAQNILLNSNDEQDNIIKSYIGDSFSENTPSNNSFIKDSNIGGIIGASNNSLIGTMRVMPHLSFGTVSLKGVNLGGIAGEINNSGLSNCTVLKEEKSSVVGAMYSIIDSGWPPKNRLQIPAQRRNIHPTIETTLSVFTLFIFITFSLYH